MRLKYITILLFVLLSIKSANSQINDLKNKLTRIESLLDSNKLKESILLYLEVKKEADNLKNIDSTAFVYLQLGEFFKENQIYFKAIELFNMVNDLYPQSTSEYEIEALDHLGTIHFNDSEYEIAKSYFSRCLLKSDKIKSPRHKSTALASLAALYHEQGQDSLALEHYYKSLYIQQQINYEYGMFESHHNIAQFYLRHNEVDSFHVHLKKTKYYASKLNLIEVDVNTLILESSYYYSQNDIRSTKSKLHEALVRLGEEKFDYPFTYRQLILGLFLASKANNELDSVIHYLKEFNIMDEKFNEKSKVVEISAIEAQYFLKENEREVRYIKEKGKAEKRASTLKQQFLGAIIIGLVLMTILVVLLYRVRNRSLKHKSQIIQDKIIIKDLELGKIRTERKQKVAENELLKSKIEHKNKELSMATLHLIGKNQTLQSLLDQFDEIPDKSIGLIQLRNEIKSKLEFDEDWEQFKMHFENVHESFFANLQSKYENLSTQELRLCAYLRINLMTKEIAQILNIQADSVKRRKNRLRGKLGIDVKESLIEFLNQI